MHLGADGVPDIAPYDREPGPFGYGLHRQSDIVQAVALRQLADAGQQALFRHPQQLFCKRRDIAHPDGHRRVAVVALDDRPAVERDDVAFLQHVGAGDAMDDDVVGRCANYRRETVVTEEVGPRPRLSSTSRASLSS